MNLKDIFARQLVIWGNQPQPQLIQATTGHVLTIMTIFSPLLLRQNLLHARKNSKRADIDNSGPSRFS